MKHLQILILIFSTILSADISNQSTNSKSTQKSDRQSTQKNINKTDTKSTNRTKAEEKSINQTLTKNISNIKSFTKSVSKTKTGNWQISINPIPYILMQMQNLGWNKKAFNLRNSDIGTSFFIDEDEEIIDLNAKAFTESKAQARGNMNNNQINKLNDIIDLLYYSGAVAERASNLMRGFHKADIININKLAQSAVYKAHKSIKPKHFDIYKCNYGGNNDIYNCNDSEFTVLLTNSVPTLLKNGVPFYSAEKIGFSTPSLVISFATNDNEALSKIEQDTQSKSVAKAIRAYTSYLEQHGQSKIASKIKTAMIEKAMTSNISNTANATIKAINSGSPTAVLRIFQ